MRELHKRVLRAAQGGSDLHLIDGGCEARPRSNQVQMKNEIKTARSRASWFLPASNQVLSLSRQVLRGSLVPSPQETAFIALLQ